MQHGASSIHYIKCSIIRLPNGKLSQVTNNKDRETVLYSFFSCQCNSRLDPIYVVFYLCLIIVEQFNTKQLFIQLHLGCL